MSALTQEYLAPAYEIDQPSVIVDESIQQMRMTEYKTANGTITGDTVYRIAFDDESRWAQLSESYIQVKFYLTRTSTARTTAYNVIEKDEVMLPDAWGLFSSVKCSLNNNQVDIIQNPGTTHVMKCLSDFSRDYADNIADNEGFAPLTVVEPYDTTDGTANTLVINPLSNSSTITTTEVAEMGQTAIAGLSVWLPGNSMSSPFQYEYTLSGTDPNWGKAATGRYRQNPYYDANFVKSKERLSKNWYPTTGGGIMRNSDYEVMSEGNGATISAVTDPTTTSLTYSSAYKPVVVWLKLSELFPILSDVCKRATRGSKLEIELNKQSPSALASAFYVNRVVAGFALTVTIERISLWLPTLEPSLAAKAYVEETMMRVPQTICKYLQMKTVVTSDIGLNSNRIKLQVDSAKIMRVLVAFRDSVSQTSYNRNPYGFMGFNMSNIFLKINNKNVPETPYDCNGNNIARALSDVYGSKKLDDEDGSLITEANFRLGPCRIYNFDTSMDDYGFDTNRISDVDLVYNMSSIPTVNYDVVCVVICEKSMKIKIASGKTKLELL